MRIFVPVVWVFVVFAASVTAKFSYDKGHCDISIYTVIRDILSNELKALVNPAMRTSSNKQVQYDLYTPNNPNKRQIIYTGDVAGLRQSYFNPKWPIRFSIHGWTGKSTSCSNAAIKDAYLSRGQFNVIIVDWSAHSLDINYARISRQFKAIATNFAKFVTFLHHETGAAYENMYVIGHSAGSHIAGLTGKLIAPNRFGVIYAIDPAGLVQLDAVEQNRLGPRDAIYVESIHTDIALLGNPTTHLSQASFFVNWGQGQPQCPNATATEFQFACDHFSALYYFAESIRQPKMYGAVQCHVKNKKRNIAANVNSNSNNNSNSTTTLTFEAEHVGVNNIADYRCACANGNDACKADVYMGGEPAVPKRGIFYASTHGHPPYGYGEMVHMRKPRNPTFLESTFLTNRDRYLLSLINLPEALLTRRALKG